MRGRDELRLRWEGWGEGATVSRDNDTPHPDRTGRAIRPLPQGER